MLWKVWVSNMVSMASYIVLSVCYILLAVYHCWYSIKMEKRVFELENRLSHLEKEGK